MSRAAKKPRWKCQAALEQELRARGYRFIAGVDEVGRGSLFGAVVAGAVILSPDIPIRGLNDSKQIEPERREVLAARIRERAIAWAVAAVDAATIDRINIYQASRLAMKLAISQLQPGPDFLLIDAVPLELSIPQQPIIQGDERCHAIAAASIVAKVYRGETLGPDVSMLKVHQTELYQRITETMLEISGEHGGQFGPLDGNRELNPAGLFIQSRPSTIYAGSNEIQRNILAKNVLELP